MIGFLKFNSPKKKWLFATAVVAVIIVAIIALNIRAQNGIETVVPKIGDLIKTLKISGKVVPSEEAKLSFENGGTIARVYKDVGDKVSSGEIIVELDSSELKADLQKAEADLSAAKLELNKFSGNGILQSKSENAVKTVIQAIKDAYTSADDAVHNKTDQFFTDPKTPNPQILFSFKGFDLKDEINNERVYIEDVFKNWSSLINNLSVSNYTDDILEKSKTYLSSISSFLDKVSRAVNGFETNTTLTQATIDKYRTDVASARTNVNNSIADLISKGDDLNDSTSNASVQVTKVASAEATVANLRSKLEKTLIRAPISGVISKQDAEVGESISPNTPMTSVISGTYEVEIFVPEVSIAGVSLGNEAKTTLDAYGSDIVFDAKVTHIDPAETIRDGVSTYKVKLAFGGYDERIKFGMTANTEIETSKKSGVLIIPLRSVITKNDGTKVVFVKNSKGINERKIEIGVGDSEGNAEVLSGLSSSEVILLNPPIK